MKSSRYFIRSLLIHTFARYEAPGPSDKRAVAALPPRAAAAALALVHTPHTYIHAQSCYRYAD